MGWKSNSKVYFSKQMLLFHLFLPFILRYVKKRTQFSDCYCFYIPYMFSFFYFWMLQFTDRFSSLNHQAYWKKKEIWPKCYLTISNVLKKLVWLLSFWIEYGNNYQLFFFPECKFNVYLCHLRWHHNRFQTLKTCYVASLISRHWKFGKLISLLLVTSMPIFRLVEFVELQN